MNSLKEWLNEERGRNKSLASEIGVAQPAITQWAEKQVPAERVFTVSKLTGIPAEILRPDIFPDKGVPT